MHNVAIPAWVTIFGTCATLIAAEFSLSIYLLGAKCPELFAAKLVSCTWPLRRFKVRVALVVQFFPIGTDSLRRSGGAVRPRNESLTATKSFAGPRPPEEDAKSVDSRNRAKMKILVFLLIIFQATMVKSGSSHLTWPTNHHHLVSQAASQWVWAYV